MRTMTSGTSAGPGLRGAIVVAAAGSAGAGLIHAAAAGSHGDSRTLVWMFAACAAAQLGWAAVVVLVPTRRSLFAGAAINGAAVVVWFLSRTVGISFVNALAEPEAIGGQDLLAAALASVAVGATVIAITQPIARRSMPNGWSAAIVLSTLALAVPALAAGHSHGGHDHLGAEHIHAGANAAHVHADGEEHGHEDGEVAHDHGVEVAGAVAHDERDHEHSTTLVSDTDEASDTHPHPDGDDHHAPTVPGQTAAPSHAHLPTTPGHAHPPVTPGQPTPPHAHPPTGPTTPTGPIVTVTDTRLTATQQRAAANLLLTTASAMKAFPTVAAVQAAGYKSIGDASTGFEHFVNWTYLSDGTELDPQRIESIVARVGPGGTRTVASAMYILKLGKTLADVPDIAGSLTAWHDHKNLCWVPLPGGGNRVTGTTVNGACPSGGVNFPTPPMLHVWLTPQPCGPFAGIEGTHGSSCGVHAH